MSNKEKIESTIRLYSKLGWKSMFAKLRFWDAPYIEVEKMIPKKGLITELGSGEGLFSNYLGLTSPKRSVYSVEIDKQRHLDSKRGLPNVKTKLGDATTVAIPKSDTIVLFHLLHHLPSFESQEELIKKCVSALKEKGNIIIVEIDKKFSIKYLLTWITDYFFVPWLFEKKFMANKIYFRKKIDWVELLRSNKLKVRSYSMDKGKPFTHIVLQCNNN